MTDSKNHLYNIDWCPYIKEAFNGFRNAIEYLGRYTHKIAISNSRILSVNESETVFSARGKLPGEPKRIIRLNNEEFIRRFLLHVLPSGFQKICYYGFLNNRTKKKKLELIEAVWKVNIHVCKVCGCMHMSPVGRTHVPIFLKICFLPLHRFFSNLPAEGLRSMPIFMIGCKSIHKVYLFKVYIQHITIKIYQRKIIQSP
ncbi:MAG: transposase [Lachnospiraceae bacterium]